MPVRIANCSAVMKPAVPVFLLHTLTDGRRLEMDFVIDERPLFQNHTLEVCYNFLVKTIERRRLRTEPRFGRYLSGKGLISTADLVSARLLQRRWNLRLGKLAKVKGLLTGEDVLRILVIQEETYDKFGEIAVRESFLTVGQVEELLDEQAKNYIYFGEALVKTGVITEEHMREHLLEYDKARKMPHRAPVRAKP